MDIIIKLLVQNYPVFDLYIIDCFIDIIPEYIL